MLAMISTRPLPHGKKCQMLSSNVLSVGSERIHRPCYVPAARSEAHRSLSCQLAIALSQVFCDLKAFHLQHHLVQFFLARDVLLLSLLELALPLVALLFDTLNLSLEVLGLNVHLAKPRRRIYRHKMLSPSYTICKRNTHFSVVSRKFFSVVSSSSSSIESLRCRISTLDLELSSSSFEAL